jgi:hypothetical protein
MNLLRRLAGIWRWMNSEPTFRRGQFVVYCGRSTPDPERVARWMMARGVKQPTCWRGPDGLVRGTGIAS